MAKVLINPDGSVVVRQEPQEVNAYYDQEIGVRIETMMKLMAFGANTDAIRARIIELNNAKKNRLLEEQ